MTRTSHTVRFAHDGLQLAGERWDADSADDTVILLHGGGQTRHAWRDTAAQVADAGWTVIALDGRGHGESTWDPNSDYTLDAFVRDLVHVVSTLDTPPVLVGASLGGMTSIVAAGEHPGLARAIVLVDVVVHVEPGGVERIHQFMTAAESFASLDDVADAIAAYNVNRPRPTNLTGLRKNVRLGEDGRWRWHWDPAFMRIDDEPRRHIDVDRLERAAANLDIPTLILWGTQSDVVTPAAIQDMLELVPSAQQTGIPGTGHMVAGDDNKVFTTELLTFLGQLKTNA
jgi:pimeloyl-ACP methyl ester carboxylesterase